MTTLPAPHADSTPRLGIPLMHAGQARKHITHNEALLAVERHLHPSVERADLGSPPADVQDGNGFVVGTPASGEWEGRAGEVATRRGGSWNFATPEPGWTLWSEADGAHIVFDGAEWTPLAAGDGGGVTDPDTLGIGGAAADATNRLAVRSPATLLTHADGGSHRLAVNREAESDTASVLFQTGYSGGAELGLVGSGDFEFKVSADGADWHTAIGVERGTGRVRFPSGGPRVPEAADVTVHVSTTGDDGANGLLPSEPVATFARAVEVLAGLDTGGRPVTVQLAPGTYRSSFTLDRLPVGTSTVQLRGPGSGTARILAPSGRPAIEVGMAGATLVVRDVFAEGGIGLRAPHGSMVQVRGSVSLGVCGGGALVADGGRVDVEATLMFSGGLAAFKATNGGTVSVNGSIARFGSRANWTEGFASAERLGTVVIDGLNVQGSSTGRRYRASGNGVVSASNATLPGSAAGVTETGGRYL